MLFFLLTGRSDEISVNYLNHFYDCRLCGKKWECADWGLPGITAILFCTQWWNRLPVERCASQLTSHSWTLLVLSHPAVLGNDRVRPALFASLSTGIDLRRCPTLTGSLCRLSADYFTPVLAFAATIRTIRSIFVTPQWSVWLNAHGNLSFSYAFWILR